MNTQPWTPPRSLRELRTAPLESLTVLECRKLKAHNHSGDLALTVAIIKARRIFYWHVICKSWGIASGYSDDQVAAAKKAGTV